MLQHWVPDRWEECLRLYLSVYEREHRRIARTFPGVETALGLLQERGIPLAVVTGKGAQSAAISLAQLGLTPYFDSIETGSPEGASSLAAFNGSWSDGGLRRIGWRISETSPSDVEASRAVGVLPLAPPGRAVRPGRVRALNPLVVFDDVPQFIQWIETTVEPRNERVSRSRHAPSSHASESPRDTGD